MENSRKLTIKHWAEEDRPREKLLLKGKSSLSNAELIAILLGTGVPDVSAVDLAKHILGDHSHDLHRLATLDVSDLMKYKGIGEAKAVTIVSALELGRRRKEAEVSRKPKLSLLKMLMNAFARTWKISREKNSGYCYFDAIMK